MENAELAWIDEEDDNIKINLNKKNNLKKLKKQNEYIITGSEFQERLREQYTKMNSNSDIYKWAFNNNQETNDNTIESLIKSNTDIIDKSNRINDVNLLDYQQLHDGAEPHNSIVSSIEFSPSVDNLGFSTGLDKKLKLFTISNTQNADSYKIINTLNTQDMPINSAKFINEGSEIIIAGRRKHFYLYNLESQKLTRCNGNNFILNSNNRNNNLDKVFYGDNIFGFGTYDGHILLYDSLSKAYKFNITINGSVNSVCVKDNNLYVVGDQSEIYLFDLRKFRNCVNKFDDTGNNFTTHMDLSSDGNYLATGSKSGFVNIFSTEQINTHSNIEPVKVYSHIISI